MNVAKHGSTRWNNGGGFFVEDWLRKLKGGSWT